MKEYAPRKVFILENGEYIELTNEEFEHRKVTDPTYADKLFLPVQGCLLETDRTHYADFYRDKERQRYLKKLDEIHGLLSIDAFDNEDDNGTDYIQNSKNVRSVKSLVVAPSLFSFGQVRGLFSRPLTAP